MQGFRESRGFCPGSRGRALLLAVCVAAAGTALGLPWPSPVAACGGLFCNNSQPVNQVAERILFVDNGDDTTTAVIEIQYQGPAERFAWVLPVPDIANPDEDISVSSELALDRLQQATNPQYNLVVRFDDDCAGPDSGFGQAGSAGAGGMAMPATLNGGPAIIVEASGSVGPFDWELVSANPDFEDPAQEAIDWLEQNDYDVGELGPDLLRPYLADDNKLLAVRLTKGNEVGSIRPLRITYAGDKPSIPIKPTAVAADPDMGIMVWVGGKERAVPKNYNLLELNEALIDWFQPMRNYDDVVTAAADEAGGHGFVTEFANSSTNLQNVILPEWERDNWARFSGQTFATGIQMLNQASGMFGAWDGFRDAVTAAITIPDGADFDIDDVLGCPTCYLNPRMSADESEPMATLDTERFRRQLFEQVVRPMLETDSLLLSQSWVTRLYTTMSPEEMTEDPVFDFNPDLPAVNNVHTQERLVGCTFTGPWRVEFEAGVVRGTTVGTWPMEVETADMPAALRISMVGTSGPPTVMIDNADKIRQALPGEPSDDDDDGDGREGDDGRDEDGDSDSDTGGDRDDSDEDDSDEDDSDEDDSDEDDGGLFCHVAAPGQGSRTGAPMGAILFGVLFVGATARRRRARIGEARQQARNGE
ncbi:MAG: DUF2330 domain-containing protein [Myxococcales bacterium]|nr:DUF2330 domain-containing protein [Myxococcales bacterium]